MNRTIKLVKGHWYRFNDTGEIHVGQYTGRTEGCQCCVCDKGNNAHNFNIYYDEDECQSWSYGNCHMPVLIEDLGESEETIID